jgi:hypothetical protein
MPRHARHFSKANAPATFQPLICYGDILAIGPGQEKLVKGTGLEAMTAWWPRRPTLSV